MTTIANSLKQVSKTNLERIPFPHFAAPDLVSNSNLLKILAWLEQRAPWQRINASFYSQSEFSLHDQDLPEYFDLIFSTESLKAIKAATESIFEVELDGRCDVVAHKLTTGDAIKVHNDFIPGKETHRILLHLNRGWEASMGGIFMTFSRDSADEESLHSYYYPKHGLLQGFEISPHSHHAVSKIHGGERYTIVYSFYKKEKGSNT